MEHTQLIAARKHAPELLGSVLVLGLGKSGCAAAEYLASLIPSRVAHLTIAGGAENASARAFADRLLEQARAQGNAGAIEVFFDRETFDARYDLCIASPGISQFSDFHLNAQAASTEVISEVEFAWRESDAASTWVAVTGTNGKTTTTALTAHILSSCGFDARAVGNIGDVALAAVTGSRAPQVYVVEVSSYQLAGTRLFAPDAAIILNITPDHLSWHRSHEHYVASKFKALENLRQTGGPAILDASDDTLRAHICALNAEPADQRGFPLIALHASSDACAKPADAPLRGDGQNAAWVDEGRMRIDYKGRCHWLCAVRDLQIKGDHNVANALAAASAAIAVGARAEAVAEALTTFLPLVHRIEPCGTVQGVECFNDSKATNVDAVLKALAAFPAQRAVLLLGGRDKGTDLAPLVERACAHAKAVVCFGEARARFLEAFDAVAPDIAVIEADTMEHALDAGLAHADAGDAVLLSPACASFDEFSCYQERGDVFRRLVAQRAIEQGREGE